MSSKYKPTVKHMHLQGFTTIIIMYSAYISCLARKRLARRSFAFFPACLFDCLGARFPRRQKRTVRACRSSRRRACQSRARRAQLEREVGDDRTPAVHAELVLYGRGRVLNIYFLWYVME